MVEFKAVVKLNGKTACGIDVPPAVIDELGGGKRPLVKVTLNDFTYRTAVGVMGERFLIPVTADTRAKSGVSAGDKVHVVVELDTAPRVIDVPADFAAALKKSARAQQAWDALSNSHKKAHVMPIEDAKTPETRARRIAKSIDKLEE